jgi:hypothetical protein
MLRVKPSWGLRVRLAFRNREITPGKKGGREPLEPKPVQAAFQLARPRQQLQRHAADRRPGRKKHA